MEAKIHKPVLIVIAGPNGSGKTTITSRVLHHEWLEDSIYINPDNTAQKEQRPPSTSSPQHISIIVFPTDAKEVKEEYNIKVTDDPKVLEKEYQIVVIGTHHKMFDSINMNNLITDKGFMCDIYGIHKPRN